MNQTKKTSPTLRRLILAQVCLMTVAAPFSWAQLAPATPPDTAEKKPVPVETTTAPAKSDETIVMSPFEVVTDTKGYYSANTMSGTRFNSKLDDLASSITVVTKDQMADFAMLDINDIFAYTGNTEGSQTFTDVTVDRNGSVSDNVQLNPTNANRVRGIAPANISLNNMGTMGRVPIDPINIDAVEISRGPNANVFGLGNPSGTVNMVAAAANLTRDRSQVQFRGDSYGGYRTSLDMNRVLLKGVLAVRGSAVFQHDGYERKPSGTDSERLNGMVKYQPFKSTTITASTSYYRMNGNRPNAVMPRDNISYWINSGRPTWDPTTQQIHINGVTVGTYTSTTYNGPDYFSAGLLGTTHAQMFVDTTGLTYWSAPQGFNNSVGASGASTIGPVTPFASPATGFGGQADRFLQTTGIPGATGTAVKPSAQPLFTTSPAVSDKSVYDYTSINLSAPNRLMDRTITSNIQVDQMVLNTQRQTLAVQAAAMREDSQRYQRNMLGAANDNGQSGQLEIDPNEKLLDGSPNPYFLRPFVGTDKPRTVWAPARWDTYRAQAAYKLDLTRESSLLKWLGIEQATAYNEYKYQINRQYSFRESFIDQKPWLTPGTYLSNQSQVTGTPAVQPITNNFIRYYVGDNVGNNVDYYPHEFNNNGTYNFVWGRAAQTGVAAQWNSEPTRIGLTATTDNSGGNSNTKTIIKTTGGVLQSHLLDDALVVTLGLREDKIYTKFGNQNVVSGQPVLLNPDGQTFNYALENGWKGGDYSGGGASGKTTNVQYVVRPFRDLPFLRSMDESAGAAHQLGSALRNLSVNYNHSNSFIVQPPGQDLFGQILPNTTGQDKSFGLGLNLLDGKINVRVTHYDTAEYNIRNGDANTTAQRVIRTDMLLVGATPATFVLQNVAGGTTPSFGPSKNQFGWIKTLNPTWSDDQVFQEFSKESGLSVDTINRLVNPSPPIAATNDIAARGTEVELNVNLTKAWTVSANFSDTQAYVKNVSSTLQKWIDQRMAIWTTLVDPAASINWSAAQLAAEPQHLWWTHNYGTVNAGIGSPAGEGTGSAHANFLSFVAAPYNVIKQLEGQADPQLRRYSAKASTNFRLSGITENHILRNFNVGGAVRWESRGAIGFYGVPDANGIYQTLDASKPIWDKGHYYYDALLGYRMRLWSDKIGATFQLNVRNIFEGGRLQRIGAYPDGTANNFRIIDPRQFLLTATFDL